MKGTGQQQAAGGADLVIGIGHPLRGDDGLAVLFVSEDIDELAQVSDRIAVLFEGRIMGPLFGRPVHFEGNIARACRLAALSGATIVPVHAVRIAGARFRVVFEAPLDGFGADLAADVRRLDAVIEAPVRRHLDQWYFLDGRLD